MKLHHNPDDDPAFFAMAFFAFLGVVGAVGIYLGTRGTTFETRDLRPASAIGKQAP